MCELFAFSGEHPALLRLSLREFASHSREGRNADGWGIAHYLDGDVRLLKEPIAAHDSACLRFIEQHPVRSALVLSHIRRATQGAAASTERPEPRFRIGFAGPVRSVWPVREGAGKRCAARLPSPRATLGDSTCRPSTPCASTRIRSARASRACC
ncbi:MAG: class II glutamine amidotransferase [Ideonella sp.]|nr:MAG: hypothetical protein F9K36_08900 [Burkholderiaceae bacterium]MBE7426807.1 class II glutamine amidotransferase [Ideonella sp.]